MWEHKFIANTLSAAQKESFKHVPYLAPYYGRYRLLFIKNDHLHYFYIVLDYPHLLEMENCIMRISELFEIICPADLKGIQLDIKTIPDIESLNGTHPMSFSVLNAGERKLYEESQNKESFIGSTESIIIYDVDIEDFYSILIAKDESPTHDLVMKKLRKYCNSIPAAYVYISHMLLHELGHYNQYLDRGKNVSSYMNWCLEEEKNNAINHQILMEQVQQRINQFIPPFKLNKSEKIKLESLIREYRNIPKEKDADNFSYSHMKQAMDILSRKLPAI